MVLRSSPVGVGTYYSERKGHNRPAPSRHRSDGVDRSPPGRVAVQIARWFRSVVGPARCGCCSSNGLLTVGRRQVRFEPLEARQLLATFTIPLGHPQVTLRLNASSTAVELIDSVSMAVLDSAPAGSLNDLTVQGQHNTDETLLVDLSGGNPIPSGGLTFHGGDAGFDTLAVAGDGSHSAVYAPDANVFGNGFIDVDTDGDGDLDRRIDFTGLEPQDISGMTNAVLSPQGSDDSLFIEDGPAFMNPSVPSAIRVSGTTLNGMNLPIEPVAFYQNVNVIVDTTQPDGDDEIVFGNTTVGGSNVNLIVETGGDGAFVAGTVLVQGGSALTVSTDSDSPLFIDTMAALQGSGTVNADVSSNGLVDPVGVSGTGTLTINGNLDFCGDCGGILSLTIVGSAPSSNNDLLRIEGPGRVLDLGSDAGLTLQDDISTPPMPGDSITLVELVDPTSSIEPDSTFFLSTVDGSESIPEGSIVELGGADFIITYMGGDGNDIVLNLPVINQPPSAEAGGPYETFEREPVTLDASNSSDPDDNIVEYAWDLDDDGSFDDHVTTGAVTTVPVAVLQSLNLPLDTPQPISLRVTDALGEFDVDDSTLTIKTSEPVPNIIVTPATSVMCGAPQTFDGSGSSHTNPNRSIVQYEWDFDYNGMVFVADATGPMATHTYATAGNHTTALRVTDDDPVQPQQRIGTVITMVTFTNTPPVADANGPYAAQIVHGQPQPLTLDGTSSSDPDVACGDSIAAYEWDIDSDGLFGASDTNGIGGNPSLPEPTGASVPNFVFPLWQPGLTMATVGLRVTDQFGESDTDQATITFQPPPTPPVADAGGPYQTGPDDGVTLNGSGSFDPDTPTVFDDFITLVEWDINNDGAFDFTVNRDPNNLQAADLFLTLTAQQLDSFGLNQFGAPNPIVLRVTDTAGLTGMDSTILTITEDRPEASFTAAPNPAACNQTITFTSTSTHTNPNRQIVTHAWDFGDGVMATGRQVTHTYSAFGSYTATLTVTDDNVPAKTDSESLVIVVDQGNLPPTANAGGPYTLDEGQPLQLQGSGTDPNAGCGDAITFQWDLNDDGTFDVATAGPLVAWNDLLPLVQFPTDPTSDSPVNTVRLRVTDSFGAASDAITTLRIYDNRPFAVITTFPDPPSVGTGEQILLDGSNSTHGRPDRQIVSYFWDFDASDGVNLDPGAPGFRPDAMGQTVPVAYSAPGVYTATLLVLDDNNPQRQDTATVQVIVAGPAPILDAGGPYTVPEGGSLNLNGVCAPATSPNCTGRTFGWDFNGDGVTDANGLTVTFSATNLDGPGLVTVTLRETGSANPVFPPDTATIQIQNVAPTITSTPATNVSSGQAYSYQASATDPAGPLDPLTWSLVSGPAGMTISPLGLVQWTPAAAGSFNATIAVNDGDGGVRQQTWTIRVVAGASAGGPYVVDEGSSIALAGTCTGCTQFQWDLDNNGTFEATGPMPIFSAAALDGPSQHTVRLRACDAGGSVCTESTATVMVRNVPPTITSSPPTDGLVGRLYEYTAAATDPAGSRDPLTWVLVSGPAGMTVSGTTGRVTWTPASPGAQGVTLEVRDGDGGAARQTWNIVVAPAGPRIQDAFLFYNNSAFDRGRAELVTVTGAEAGGHLKGFDVENGATELASFLAYPGFAGDVSVAAGDVDGDGRLDVIAAAGASAPGGPVKVFRGGDGRLVRSFFAFPFGVTGVTVAAGDVNGDGFTDIIAGAGPGSPGGHVKVFSGRDHSELWNYFFFEAAAGGVRVAAGDVNGDGFDDIIVGAGAGGPGGHVKVFDGATSDLLANFFAYPGFAGGIYVAAGDVTGDGRADIITGAGPGAGPHVKVFDGATLAERQSFFAYDATFSGGVRVATGDIDADGRADIITGAGPGAGPHVKVFSGQTLAELSSFFAYTPSFAGGVFVAAGDLDGGPTANPDDQTAIDPNREPLRFGETATARNVSSYLHGINGLGFDILNLPDDGGGITTADFSFSVGNDNFPDAWADGPAPTGLDVLPGAGPGGADRILVTFEDDAIVDTWLRITVHANENTGLAADEDFFFGNVIGETGAAIVGEGQFFGRDAADLHAIGASGLFRRTAVGDPSDIDANGIINAFDLQAISNAGLRQNVILAITPQPVPVNLGAAAGAISAPAPLPLAGAFRPSTAAKDELFAGIGRKGPAADHREEFVPLVKLAGPRSWPAAAVEKTDDQAPRPFVTDPAPSDLVLEDIRLWRTLNIDRASLGESC